VAPREIWPYNCRRNKLQQGQLSEEQSLQGAIQCLQKAGATGTKEVAVKEVLELAEMRV
jgi:hypothetical protein